MSDNLVIRFRALRLGGQASRDDGGRQELHMKTIKDIPIKGKSVLVRADLDIPIGKLTANSQRLTAQPNVYRLDKMTPTIEYILSKNPRKQTIIGHLGRPGGKKDPKLSLEPVERYLQNALGVTRDKKAAGSSTLKVKEQKPLPRRQAGLRFSSVANRLEILENLRFDPREEANDPQFAKELARGHDIFVQECFSTCHRKHASITQIPRYVPQATAGLNLEREVTNLSKLLLNQVARPFIVIIGGSKVATKLPLIREFEKVADQVLVGSKYLKKMENGKWKMENDNSLLDLPNDIINNYLQEIAQARTILWNGPVGQYELDQHARGTKEIAKAIARSSAYRVVGGSNTIDALAQYRLIDRMDFVSTGGGAMLEFVLGKRLPGLEAIGYYG